MVDHKRQKPVVLCILDGWGYSPEKENNAIEQGKTPVWHRLVAENPHELIKTYGKNVGLPDGQMGNSEVGHMNLGAGRVVMQDLPRIDDAIETGEIEKNKALLEFISKMKKSKGTAHVMGLISPGGVHSHQDQIAAVVKILDREGIPVDVHAFLDGRDTAPDSGIGYVDKFEKDISGCKNAKIRVVSGRYYAMDRDNRWDREKLAYDAMVFGKGPKAASAHVGIDQSYKNKKLDEFVIPVVIGDYAGMKDGDGVLMGNFRADRARQILLALLDPAFDKFDRGTPVKFASACGMAEYSKDHNKFLITMFPPEELKNIFGEIVSRAGLKQLRISETEKYAHVTFFFNGGEEKMFDGEERILVPSPKVATYDLKPEMSCEELTDKLTGAIESGKFDVIIANYPNGDMVGHTGIMEAAVKAVEAVDKCLARLEASIKKTGGVMFVTADHGNCEKMVDEKTHGPYTAHTIGPVEFVMVNGPKDVKKLRDGGKLADVSPTMLDILGLEKPKDMTGSSLLVRG